MPRAVKSSDRQPSGAPQSRVEQRIVAPLILGVAALIFIANLPMEDSEGVTHNPLRGIFDRRDRLLLDQFHEKSRKTPPRADIIVLGIDDASQKLETLWPDEIAASPALQAMKLPWVWPRRVWAHVIDRLVGAGAKCVFLDLAFKAPSADPEDDRLLHEAIVRHKGKVILGAKFQDEFVGNALSLTTSLMYPSQTITGKDVPDDGDFGQLNFWGDEDAIVRRVHFRITPGQAEGGVADPDEKPLPAVCLVAAEKVNPSVAAAVRDVERIRFCDATGAYPPISIHQIFVDTLWKNNYSDGTFFKDKVIMVGATSTDLQDFQQTVVGRMAGVQVHAHALTALLAHSFIHESPESWRWVGMVIAVLLAWLLVSRVRQPLYCVGTMALISAAGLYGSFLLFDRANIEFSPLSPALAFSLCGIAGVTGNFVVQLRESRRLRRSLGRYTSPEFVDMLLTDRKGIFEMLGGTDRNVTILFSDVRGFTSMSENMEPSEVVSVLNEYLSRMVEIVFKKNGVVDKFIGDAVMALWGSFRADQADQFFREDARNAIIAALSMHEALAELNAAWKERGIQPLQIGIGLHQGTVIAGNIGSESPYEKMDITVIGDNVNTASRLESATKQYGVGILLSETVRESAGDAFLFRSADLVTPVGKARPVKIFTVIGPAGARPPSGLETFETGMLLYREGRFAEAATAFTKAALEGLDDRLTHLYEERCRELAAHPPEKWDGVYVMTKK